MLLFNKVKSSFLIFLIILFSLHLNLFSEEANVIRVGYNANTGLIYDFGNRGKEGIGFELLKKIETVCDLRFDFIKIEGDAFKALENNEVDIIGLYLRTPEREEKYLYSSDSFNTVISSLATKGPKGIYYDDPQSIDGKTVATYEGNPANAFLNKYLEANNISVTYIFESFQNYLFIDADFYLTYTESSVINNFYTVLNFESSPTYLLANFTNKETMDEIDNAYSKIQAEEGYFFNELVSKYNSSAVNLAHRELTRKEVEILRAKPLRVGYVDNHRPFTYLDDEGKANGALIELMDVFAKKYSFDVEYIPYSLDTSYDSHSDFDVILSLLGNEKYELEHYVPTESYYSMAMVATVSNKIAKINYLPFEIIKNTPRIGFPEYLYINYDSFQKMFPDNELVFFGSFEEMIDAYKDGSVDMAIYTASGSTYADAYLDKGENYLFGTDFMLDFYMSFSKSIASDYVPIFNIILDTVTVREYEALLNKHTSTYYPRITVKAFIVEYWVYVFAIGIAIALIFLSYNNKVREEHKDLQIQAYRSDRLTGLVSMSYYYEKVQEVLSIAKNNEYELISFDIDYFRTINTYYSMEQGTAVIVEIARALENVFKETEAIHARKTAEQFYVLRKIGEGPAIEILHKIYILPAIRTVLGDRYNAVLSYGFVTIDNCEETISDIIAYADYARMRGKSSHVTTFIGFDRKMKKAFTSNLHITFKMEQGIKEKEFKVFYQPKVDFRTLRIVGAEALVRWIPSPGEIIYPNDFIDVFESNGFISTLDMYVFKDVCRYISELCDKVDVPIISVNLSAVTVLEDTLISQLMAILDEYDVKPSQIDLEITETAILGSEEIFLSKIRQLKKLGFIVSIDDFGSGVSSLNRLCSIHADILKMDKAFFEQKDSDERTAIVVDEVITLSKRLEMKIVAEGVETYEQAKWLRDLDCDIAQGYYFSKPISEEIFFEYIQTGKSYAISKV